MTRRDIKHTRIRKLNCYDDVMALVRGGARPSTIARYIREDCKEMLDVGHRSVEQAVRRFIASLPPGTVLTLEPEVAKAIDLDGYRSPNYIAKMRKQMEEGLDSLKEMGGLIRVQIERIEKLLEVEAQVPFGLESVRREIKMAHDMLLNYVKVEMDLGIRHKQAFRADIHSTQRIEAGVGENMLQLLMSRGFNVQKLLEGGNDVVEAEFVKLLSEPGDMKKLLREGLIEAP